MRPICLLVTTILALLATLYPATSAAEPIEVSLDGDWKFRRDPDDVGLTQGWQAPGLDDGAWETIAVPGDWGANQDGIGWYRRKVTLPAGLKGRTDIRLIFRQVDDSCKVYLNGKLAKEHASWSTPFNVDPSSFIGTEGTLDLALRVVDTGGGGGILGHVVLKSVTGPKDIYETEWHAKKAPHQLDELGGLVMYSVYTRNFTPEGTFKAAQARLPELKELGVNILWLLPIHEVGVEKRKGPDGSPYAIKDYYSVDHNLGTKEDFREFVKAAHALGMKVIIDCVMNHTSPDSEWATKHPEWFIRDENGKPIPEVASWSDVVDLDWKNKEVWEEGAKMMEYWVRDLDIDGYRCDVADMMPREWWSMVRGRLDKIKPGIVMLAESQEAGHHLNGFDLTYCEGVRDTAFEIVEGRLTAEALGDEMMARLYGYPKGATQILFVENHDKERAMDVYHGPERTKAVSVLTATLPGVPLLYTGTEVGATGKRDDFFFTRAQVNWAQDPAGMRAFWTDLLKTRAAHKALQTGDLTIVPAKPAAAVFAFERKAGADRVLVVVNLSDSEQQVSLTHDLLPKDGLRLPAWGWKIIPADKP